MMIAAIDLVNIDMDLTRLDLNLFVAFEAIYTERSITRAAAKLAITQPAASNALARLRSALGDPLFVKTSAGMLPTAVAESIAPQVSEALYLLSMAAKQTSAFDPQHSTRVFRVSLLDPYDSLVLPALIREVRAQAPMVELQITRVARSQLLGQLENGTIEIAAEAPLKDATDLIYQPLQTDHWVCALRPDHPMVGRELDLDSYLSLSHLHVSNRPSEDAPVDLALRRMGRRRAINLRMRQYNLVNDAVRSTDLAVTLTEGLARDLGLAVLPLPVKLPPLELRLYRHRRSDADAATKWMYDLTMSLFRSLARSEPS